jgi:transcriptional regulator GlxA family with amidase domain
MPHITIALYENSLASSISLPAEMLTAADQISRAHRLRKSRLTIELAGIAPQVKTFGPLKLTSDCNISDITHTDLIILPALWRNPQLILQRHPELVNWVKQHHQQQTLICSVGSASNILASAGLLDNKPATTHWYDFEQFSTNYPDVQLQKRHLITQSGKVFCAGSVNSVADLMVHFIRDFYNEDIAHHVERQFSPEIRQDYEHHLYADSSTRAHHDEEIVSAQQWLQNHYDRDLKINELVAHSGLNARTLNRRFKLATGLTPMQYLQRHRMTIAEDLLKNSNLALSEIAVQVGYGDYSHFAELFKKWLSISPKAYRQAARGKLFLPN